MTRGSGILNSVLRRGDFLQMRVGAPEAQEPSALAHHPTPGPCFSVDSLHISGLSWVLPRQAFGPCDSYCFQLTELGGRLAFEDGFWGVGEEAYRTGGDVWQTTHIRFN